MLNPFYQDQLLEAGCDEAGAQRHAGEEAGGREHWCAEVVDAIFDAARLAMDRDPS